MPGVHQQVNRRGRAKEFEIHAFPKEFERNIWEEIDRRFYIILFASLALVYGSIVYLSNVQYSKEKVEDAIKRAYLKKVYQVELVTEEVKPKEVASTETGKSGFEEAPVEEKKKEKPDVRAQRDKGKRAEGRGVSASERAARRRRGEAARKNQRSAIAAKVVGGGVLGVLTAGGEGGTGVAEEGVLGDEAIAGGVGDLDKILSGAQTLQTASASQRRSRLGARTIGGGEGQKGAGIDDLIEGGIGESASYSLARQGDFSLKIARGKVTGRTSKTTARSADAITTIINKHQDAIVDCYKRVARLNPNLKGSISIQFTIEPNGRVSAVRIISSTLKNSKVESCIKRRVRSWRFQPIDPKEGKAIFLQKFVFIS